MAAKKRVVVLGYYGGFAGAGEFANELRRRPDWDCDLVVGRKDEYQDFWIEYEGIYWPTLGFFRRRELRRKLLEADLVLVCGCSSLDLWSRIVDGAWTRRDNLKRREIERRAERLQGHCETQTTAVLVSDSQLLQFNEYWNDLFAKLRGLHVFCMPDLIRDIHSVSPVHAFWPPVDCSTYRVPEESREWVVGHSPSKAKRRHQKGSDLIEEVCRRTGVPLEVTTELPHVEAQRRKARASLFIDQISDTIFPGFAWHGGVGKSGLEALSLGCAVLTSGLPPDSEPELPRPPVVYTDRKRFESDLLSVWADRDGLVERGRASGAWADRYATPRAMVDRILRCVGMEGAAGPPPGEAAPGGEVA